MARSSSSRTLSASNRGGPSARATAASRSAPIATDEVSSSEPSGRNHRALAPVRVAPAVALAGGLESMCLRALAPYPYRSLFGLSNHDIGGRRTFGPGALRFSPEVQHS